MRATRPLPRSRRRRPGRLSQASSASAAGSDGTRATCLRRVARQSSQRASHSPTPKTLRHAHAGRSARTASPHASRTPSLHLHDQFFPSGRRVIAGHRRDGRRPFHLYRFRFDLADHVVPAVRDANGPHQRDRGRPSEGHEARPDGKPELKRSSRLRVCRGFGGWLVVCSRFWRSVSTPARCSGAVSALCCGWWCGLPAFGLFGGVEGECFEFGDELA